MDQTEERIAALERKILTLEDSKSAGREKRDPMLRDLIGNLQIRKKSIDAGQIADHSIGADKLVVHGVPGQLINQTVLTVTNQANQTYYYTTVGAFQAIAGMALTYTPPVNSKLSIMARILALPNQVNPEVYFRLQENGTDVAGDLEYRPSGVWDGWEIIHGGDLVGGTGYTWTFGVGINTNPCTLIVNGSSVWTKAVIEIKAAP